MVKHHTLYIHKSGSVLGQCIDLVDRARYYILTSSVGRVWVLAQQCTANLIKTDLHDYGLAHALCVYICMPDDSMHAFPIDDFP